MCCRVSEGGNLASSLRFITIVAPESATISASTIMAKYFFRILIFVPSRAFWRRSMMQAD